MPNKPYSIPPLGGLRRDLPAQLLALHESPDVKGLWPLYGRLRRMPGKAKLVASALDTSGGVMGMYQWTRKDGSSDFVAATQEKSYKYNVASGQFDSIHDSSDYTGGESDLHDFIPFFDSAGAEILCITNYVDTVRKWSGSGTLEDLGGSPNRCKNFEVYKNYLIQTYLHDGGAAYPRRVRWSALGNGESWPAENYLDLTQTADHIMRPAALRSSLAVYKEKSISMIDYVGGSLVFNVQENFISGRGLIGPRALIKYGYGIESHYLIGSDLEVHAFDGIDLTPLSSNVSEVLQKLHPTYRKYLVAIKSEEYDKLVWCMPGRSQSGNYDLLIFDLKIGSWWVREDEPVRILSAVEAVRQESLTWDTLPYGAWDYFDAPLGWDSIGMDANETLVFWGGSDGYIRYWLAGATDDGENMPSRYTYPWDNLDGRDDTQKVLNKILVEVANEGSDKTLTLKVFKDQNYTAPAVLDDDGNTSKTVNLYHTDSSKDYIVAEVDISVIGYKFAVQLSTTNQVWTGRVVDMEYETIGVGRQ